MKAALSLDTREPATLDCVPASEGRLSTLLSSSYVGDMQRDPMPQGHSTSLVC